MRSPHAHATVALDLAAARAVPGVHAVLAFADLPGVFADEPAFAGAPVAALACEDAASAAPPSQALAASYEQLGFVVSTEQALSEQRLQEDPVEDESGDVEAGMAEADVIIEAEYATGAQIHHALEPHCAVVQWLRRRAARLRLDAGHLGRAPAARARPSTSIPTAYTSPASSWAAASAPSRARRPRA